MLVVATSGHWKRCDLTCGLSTSSCMVKSGSGNVKSALVLSSCCVAASAARAMLLVSDWHSAITKKRIFMVRCAWLVLTCFWLLRVQLIISVDEAMWNVAQKNALFQEFSLCTSYRQERQCVSSTSSITRSKWSVWCGSIQEAREAMGVGEHVPHELPTKWCFASSSGVEVYISETWYFIMTQIYPFDGFQ